MGRSAVHGTAPIVVDVIQLRPDHVEVVLSGPIEVGNRTTIRHDSSGVFVELAWLPGDVTGNGVSDEEDVLALVNTLGGGVARPAWATDLDRSGETTPLDLLRAIDLLLGADTFQERLNDALP